MASFDTASKKQVETNPQDFVNLCFKFKLTNITALELITPEQPTVEMHQADILVIGDDWKGKFDHLSDICEVIYLERTPSISTTEIIEVINEK